MIGPDIIAADFAESVKLRCETMSAERRLAVIRCLIRRLAVMEADTICGIKEKPTESNK